MFKKIKNKLFIVISTFLALVLSIVSFGTYRNEAKAEGGLYSGFVGSVLDDILLFESPPEDSNAAAFNGNDYGVLIIDRRFFGNEISDGPISVVEYWNTQFCIDLINALSVRLAFPEHADLTSLSGIIDALIEINVLTLVIYISNNNYQDLLTGEIYTMQNTSAIFSETQKPQGDTTIVGMLQWTIESYRLEQLYRMINTQLFSPLYTWLNEGATLSGNRGMTLRVYNPGANTFYNATV